MYQSTNQPTNQPSGHVGPVFTRELKIEISLSQGVLTPDSCSFLFCFDVGVHHVVCSIFLGAVCVHVCAPYTLVCHLINSRLRSPRSPQTPPPPAPCRPKNTRPLSSRGARPRRSSTPAAASRPSLLELSRLGAGGAAIYGCGDGIAQLLENRGEAEPARRSRSSSRAARCSRSRRSHSPSRGRSSASAPRCRSRRSSTRR